MKLRIPIRLSRGHGFFKHKGADRDFLGYKVQFLRDGPYHYIELQGLAAADAPAILAKVRAALEWAAVRLDFGFFAEDGEISTTTTTIFNGHVPTLYDENLQAHPFRGEGNQTTEEADARLFSALTEAAAIAGYLDRTCRPEVRAACQLFAAVDFESSANASLLSLTSILEILAAPAPRPDLCLEIIEEAIRRMDREAKAAAADPTLQQALVDMRRGAKHWKAESIRSSVRRLAVSVATALGDADPPEEGRKAVVLYDKRSDVTHNGASATLAEVKEARRIVREAIAVEVGCYHKIRERYPAG